MINKPKGTKDVLPADVYLWHHVEETARKTAETYAFHEIRTPVFEYTDLFSRGVGDTTDVVNKEMYTFLDKGGRSITLRPEGTAGVARAFVENGLSGGAMPFKAYYIISAFRYERPQAGRLREFHQFGAEMYGAAGALADAELISFADRFLKNLRIQNITLRINSIGCKTCREAYKKALREYLDPHRNTMCVDCQTRLESNPLRILDCKEEQCREIVSMAPKMLDYLCDDCLIHFKEVQELLTTARVDYVIDPFVVRGLDYYNRTVFEFTSDDMTVLGGGRYDTLLEQIGEKPVPAVGFAAGVERLLLLMNRHSVVIPKDDTITCYILGIDSIAKKQAVILANQLRADGVSCEMDVVDRSVKAQFKYADKIGARFVVIIGDTELTSQEAVVKDMTNSSSERVKFSELTAYLQNKKDG